MVHALSFKAKRYKNSFVLFLTLFGIIIYFLFNRTVQTYTILAIVTNVVGARSVTMNVHPWVDC